VSFFQCLHFPYDLNVYFFLSVCLSACDMTSVPKPFYGFMFYGVYALSVKTVGQSQFSRHTDLYIYLYFANQMHNINYIKILYIYIIYIILCIYIYVNYIYILYIILCIYIYIYIYMCVNYTSAETRRRYAFSVCT